MTMFSRLLLLMLAGFTSVSLWASPADYIFMPVVENGEKEIELKAGSAKAGDGSHENVSQLSVGYGVNDVWFTEFAVEVSKNSGADTKVEAVEFENKFLLTQPGEYPVDIGLITEFEIPTQSYNHYEFQFGPLLQTDLGKTQMNLNVIFEKQWGNEADTAVEMHYQWQAKYRWKREFEFGLQGLGEVGKWDNWEPAAEQVHLVGPAVFGKLSVGEHHAFKYNAAWLAGLSAASPDTTVRVQLEYEF